MGNIRSMSNLGERLKSSREALKLSQTTVGNFCGVSRAAVSQWENNVTVPTRENLEAAADILRAEPSEYQDMPEGPRYQGYPRRAVRVIL